MLKTPGGGDSKASIVSTAKVLLKHQVGVRRRHLGAKFHESLESLKIILDTLEITPNDLW